MAKKPKRESWHVACAKLLMDEYGLNKDLLDEVIQRIEAIYHNVDMPHFVIIRSIRGFVPIPQTRTLQYFLERNQTHPPKHKKGEPEYNPDFVGDRYIERDYD